MKKALIAGAASAVLAAMPVAGVFAADTQSHTDTINISIDAVCTLGTVTDGVAQDDDDTAHNPTEVTSGFDGVWSDDSLSASLAAGTQHPTLGTTTFTVRCNNSNGYTLSAKTGNAAGTLVNGSNTIATADGSAFAAGTAETSYWNFKLSGASTGMTIANGYNAAHAVPTPAAETGAPTVIVTGAANSGNVQGGQSVTVTYGAGIDNFQPTGTYTGTVVYSLASL